MPSSPVPANRCEFRCLGPVALAVLGRDVLPLRTRKQLALLFYLARRPGRPVGRDELIELLWSGDAEKQGRHSLSQSVSLVGKTLGFEAITASGRDRLVLAPGAVWLDVNEFERAVSEGRQDEALALWRGPLFEGLWVRRAPNLERWLAEERDRLLRMFRRVAHGRLEVLRAAGDQGTVRDESERLLDLDPLDEKAMLAHLEALTLLDDRSLALRRYGVFERRLREELDAEPGSALRAWVRRHRRGDGAARRPVPLLRVSEMTVLPTPQPLFGRTEEFALLWDGWEQAKVGKGSFIIIEGDAGIGKTALATKLVNQAHVAGGSVCFVRCYRSEKSVPFAPVTALIRQLSRLPGFVGLDPVWIGELTRLVPELRDRYPSAPTPMAVDDAARHRLSDATVQAALAVSEELPLMVVIDDLQDADEASLAVVHYFARQLREQSALVIAMRRVGAEGSDVEKAFLEATKSTDLARSLPLRGLGTKDIQRLVHHVLASKELPVSAESISLIAAISSGNPLQAIESAIAMTLDSGTSKPTPFAETAGDRVAALSIHALEVAGALTITGRPMTQYEISVVSCLPIAELARAISELETQQLVRRAGGKLGLAHDLYAGSIESCLDSSKAMALNGRVAAMLSASASRDPASHYQAARHFQSAGQRTVARKQALDAARFALSLGAVRERAAALALAMDVSDGFDADLAANLGACHLELREFDRVESLCGAAGRMGLNAEQQASFEYLEIAKDYLMGGVRQPQLIARLGDLLAREPQFPFGISARTLLMRLAGRSGDRRLAIATSRGLRRLLRSTSESTNGHDRLSLAYIAAKYYSPHRATPLLRLALETAVNTNDLDLEHLCRTGLAAVCRQAGDFRRSVEEAELSRALANRALSPHLEALDISDGAAAEMAQGNYEKARLMYEAAASTLRSHGDLGSMAHVTANLGELFIVSDRADLAGPAFESALQSAKQVEVVAAIIQALGGLAMCAQRSGDYEMLGRRCRELVHYGGGRERVFHDRWMTEAALAWNLALSGTGPEAAMSQLRIALADLKRRDIDHWMTLAVEALRIRKHFWKSTNQEELEAVELVAHRTGAEGILEKLASVRAPNY